MSLVDTTIALSKRKMTFSLLGCLAFMAAGVWFVTLPASLIPNGLLGDPASIRSVGVVALGFFGLLGLLLAKKLRDPAPGLVLTPTGFVDNSSGLAAGLVPWADVAGIRELELMRQKLVVLLLRDPAAYIDRQPSSFKRQLMKTNLSSYGSPIHISANALECAYPELLALFRARLSAHQGAE